MTDANYSGTAAGTLVIAPATATVTLGGLAQTYDGDPKPATATTDPAGLAVAITYDGNAAAPTDAGSYAVVGDGERRELQRLGRGHAGDREGFGDGDAGRPGADLRRRSEAGQRDDRAGRPGGRDHVRRQRLGADQRGQLRGGGDGERRELQRHGRGHAGDRQGRGDGDAGRLGADLRRRPEAGRATTDPEGLAVAFTYDGNAGRRPTRAATRWSATVNDANYGGSAAGTLVIAKATATVTLGDLAQTYDGDPKPATATTDPEGLAVAFTYDGDAAAPTNAGSYAVSATVTDANYSGTAAGTLVIAPAAATVTLGDLAQTYDGDPKPATAITDPEGLAVAFTYDGDTSAPTNAGSYAVVATVSDANYNGTAAGTLVIAPAAATVTLGDLAQIYDGDPKPATAITDPEGLDIAITYEGDAAAPVGAGSYAVVATVTAPNYAGSASGTLVIEDSYLSWMEGFLTPAPAAQLDSDGDGWLNLAEYLFDTDPFLRSSAPSVTPIRDGNTLQLHLSPNPVTRSDATLGAQTSTDLFTWTSEGITSVANGFLIPGGGLRLFCTAHILSVPMRF